MNKSETPLRKKNRKRKRIFPNICAVFTNRKPPSPDFANWLPDWADNKTSNQTHNKSKIKNKTDQLNNTQNSTAGTTQEIEDNLSANSEIPGSGVKHNINKGPAETTQKEVIKDYLVYTIKGGAVTYRLQNLQKKPQIPAKDSQTPNVVVVGNSKIRNKGKKAKTLAEESKMNYPKPELHRTNVQIKFENTPKVTQVVNMNKSQGSTAATAQPGGSTKPISSVPVTNPAPQTQQVQPKGFLGRMTASSFMQTSVQPRWAAPTYSTKPFPSGIPRSFLYEQMMNEKLQQESNFNTQTDPSTTGPVWEAKIPKPSWNPVQQEPSQTFDQTNYMYEPVGQLVNQSYAYNQPGPMLNQSVSTQGYDQPMLVQVDVNAQTKQQYSPSDAYVDTTINEDNEDVQDESVSQDSQQSNLKRLSAFQRLGPAPQAKKPKLTINLLFNKEQAVRKVVDQTEIEEKDPEKYTPAYLKPDVQTSLDDTVIKYLLSWPWKKNIVPRRTTSVRNTKSERMSELEQMEELYEKENVFFQITVTGYPESWNKEDVLDAVLDSVKGKSLIPCFIEFSKTECKFLVIRSRPALVAIHKYGFIIYKGKVRLTLTISYTSQHNRVLQRDFMPRLILKKRLSMATEKETELNLTEFTLKTDISHFIYFPLNRVTNQSELIQLPSSVQWELLTKLNLSHNRITSLSGFDLPRCTPNLKNLDLSFNYLESISTLMHCRLLPLNTIALEGNPLCIDYIQQEMYIKVLKLLFPALKMIDGVTLTIPGTMPPWNKNYCPPEAKGTVAKVIEILFPLLDAESDERLRCEELYDVNAIMTVTYMSKLRNEPIFKDFRSLFFRARVVDEGNLECIVGSLAISKLIDRWPRLHHDPTTFSVDVMFHTETTTIFKVSGIMRVTTGSLAEDEHLLSFTRTIAIHSLDTVEFKITNEMIYWDLPDKDTAKNAFRMTLVLKWGSRMVAVVVDFGFLYYWIVNALKQRHTPIQHLSEQVTLQNSGARDVLSTSIIYMGRNNLISTKLESPPSENLKHQLIEIFMYLTEMERKPSEKCLEIKDWHLKHAIEYFTQLLKLDNLEPIMS